VSGIIAEKGSGTGRQQGGFLARLAKEFVRLPGIGQKTAQRLAFHIMKAEKEEALRLADAIRDVKERVAFCTQCRNIAEESLCDICLNPKRDRTKILVVEEPSTLQAIEQSKAFHGLYHVLFGALSPLDGVGPADIRAHELEERVRLEKCRKSSLPLIPPSKAKPRLFISPKSSSHMAYVFHGSHMVSPSVWTLSTPMKLRC